MSEDLKKRQELKRQIESRAQVANIDVVEKVANFLNHPKKWMLIESVATLKTSIETQRFIISFDYLDTNECVFEQFCPAQGRKLIQIFEQISKCEVRKFPELRLIRDSVNRIKPYDTLFSNLTREVDQLQETEFCGGRIFFFITEPYFHIVSVETKHRDID